MRRSLCLWLGILCLMLGILAVADQAQAQTTFTVNSPDSVADGVCDAHCSFDDAILAANAAPGADRIEFNITPAGSYVFPRMTALPAITDAVVIDGYTQPGASANTNAVGGLNSDIRLSISAQSVLAAGLSIDASDVTIRGLSIFGFTDNIRVSDTSTNVVIAGNYLGTYYDGATIHPSSVNGIACGLCAGVTVGGSAPADRNVISGNIGAGIKTSRPNVSTPVALVVRGNLIGTNKDANASVSNGIGISLTMPTVGASANDSVIIGGAGGALGVEEGNVLAGNLGQGIAIDRSSGSDTAASQVTIRRNFIGTTYDALALGNGGAGVMVSGAVAGSVIENRIAKNAGAGVAVLGPLTAAGSGILIQGNTITQNTGMAIDLGNDGRTENEIDGTDFDTGANDLLNFPFIGQAELDTATGNLAIQGILPANPNRTYTIEFYNNGNAAGARPNGAEARTPIGTKTVTTNGGGFALVTVTLTGVASVGDLIAAITHDLTARNFSSEVSDQMTVTAAPPSISGTITSDGTTPISGISVQLTGTQTRTQTTNASGFYQFFNLTPGGDYTVTPDTAGYSYTPPSIGYTNLTQVQSAADFVATPVAQTFTVNVTTDPGDGTCTLSECTLREAIAAANAHPGLDTIAFAIPGAGPHVLTLNASLPAIGPDLVIDGYTQPGAAPNTNATGGLNGVLKIALERGGAMNMGLSALNVTGSHVTIRGLAIAGFGTGITVVQPSGLITDIIVAGNYFGTTPDGLSVVPNSGSGIYGYTPAELTVGGTTPAARNLISGHVGAGVGATAGYSGRVTTFNVLGNLIGTDATGLAPLPNDYGVWFAATPNPPEPDIVRIGGDTDAERNVISGNHNAVHLERAVGSDDDAADQKVVGNYIGVGADGATPLGNSNDAVWLFGQVKYLIKQNVIANNSNDGVTLQTTPTTGGFGVELSENRIFMNGFLAVDLGSDGRTPNDTGDADTGANNQQNFPVLTAAQEGLHVTKVTGTLDSAPNRTYRIELFSTGSFLGAGRMAREFLGSFTVATDGSGAASFTHDIPALFQPSERFLATATDVDAMMTSELSDDVALTYGPTASVEVTTTFNGEPLDSTTLTLSGDREFSYQTGGHWLFGLPVGGTYVITPSAPGYVFEPASATLTNLTTNQALTFAARPAIYTRYLPEGAAGPFWETSIALLNGTLRATTAEVSFLKPDGTSTKVDVPLKGPGHAVIDPSTIDGLNGATFSTVVKASEPVVASRTMRWGQQRELGAHAEQALGDPRTSWYFAEGATGCFDLFYLLVNPGATEAEVDVTFVRRAPQTPLVRHYTVGAFSRATIQANGEDGLKASEVSARIEVTNGQPIVAERAMYSRCYGTPWRGGHDAVASEAPAMEWFFAEGATGSFFDLYLLIANFEGQDAQIDVEYLLDDGSTLKKRYTVPAGSRVTIDVAGESPLLEQAAVSAIVRSKNGVPVVAERSQWWPHGGWYEGHASAGVVQTGVEWQIAGAEVGGDRHTQAFLLIANTSDDVGSAQVTLVFDDGSVASLPQPLSLNAHSRTTVALGDLPAARDKKFGVMVESLGSTPAPIVVELSTYNDTPDTDASNANGASRFWGAGTNIVATRIR